MNIINVPKIILNIFKYLSLEEYNNIIKNDLEYFLKIINHKYLINNLWFNFYDARINIKNIILNNINKIPEYCNKIYKIIIKKNYIFKLENINNCNHLEIWGNNTISKLENINNCNHLMIGGNNTISKLENVGNCSYLKICGNNTISKLENIDNCIYLKICGNNTISKLENICNCSHLIIWHDNILKFKI